MPVSEGKVVKGTVTGITNFGAFIELEEGKSGLVHISEISHDYVEKVSDYLKKGQKVNVKILSVSDDGKIGLSIRQAQAKSTQPAQVKIGGGESQKGLSFEDKMNSFLKQSSERHEQIKGRDGRKGSSGGFRTKEY